ncbi:hypothetical protein HK096_011248, partial [Nowakowskiella sp. JEL0078]
MRKCCCCFPLRFGTLVLAIILFIAQIFEIVYVIRNKSSYSIAEFIVSLVIDGFIAIAAAVGIFGIAK